jgi:hypothetical protein
MRAMLTSKSKGALSTYLRTCPVPLQAANSTDDDWLDYNNELRIGILEAYSGILQGLGPGGCFYLFISQPCMANRVLSC